MTPGSSTDNLFININMETGKHTEHPDVQRGHETRDAHFRSVVFSGLGLLALMFLGMLVSLGLMALLKGRSVQPGAHPDTFVELRQNTLPPAPRLQAASKVSVAPTSNARRDQGRGRAVVEREGCDMADQGRRSRVQKGVRQRRRVASARRRRPDRSRRRRRSRR